MEPQEEQLPPTQLISFGEPEELPSTELEITPTLIEKGKEEMEELEEEPQLPGGGSSAQFEAFENLPEVEPYSEHLNQDISFTDVLASTAQELMEEVESSEKPLSAADVFYNTAQYQEYKKTDKYMAQLKEQEEKDRAEQEQVEAIERMEAENERAAWIKGIRDKAFNALVAEQEETKDPRVRQQKVEKLQKFLTELQQLEEEEEGKQQEPSYISQSPPLSKRPEILAEASFDSDTEEQDHPEKGHGKEQIESNVPEFSSSEKEGKSIADSVIAQEHEASSSLLIEPETTSSGGDAPKSLERVSKGKSEMSEEQPEEAKSWSVPLSFEQNWTSESEKKESEVVRSSIPGAYKQMTSYNNLVVMKKTPRKSQAPAWKKKWKEIDVCEWSQKANKKKWDCLLTASKELLNLFVKDEVILLGKGAEGKFYEFVSKPELGYKIFNWKGTKVTWDIFYSQLEFLQKFQHTGLVPRIHGYYWFPEKKLAVIFMDNLKHELYYPIKKMYRKVNKRIKGLIREALEAALERVGCWSEFQNVSNVMVRIHVFANDVVEVDVKFLEGGELEKDGIAITCAAYILHQCE